MSSKKYKRDPQRGRSNAPKVTKRLMMFGPNNPIHERMDDEARQAGYDPSTVQSLECDCDRCPIVTYYSHPTEPNKKWAFVVKLDEGIPEAIHWYAGIPHEELNTLIDDMADAGLIRPECYRSDVKDLLRDIKRRGFDVRRGSTQTFAEEALTVYPGVGERLGWSAVARIERNLIAWSPCRNAHLAEVAGNILLKARAARQGEAAQAAIAAAMVMSREERRSYQ